MKPSVLTRASLVAIATAICTWGSQAYASAFQLVEQNASGLGNAYAGQAAAAEDASTIFFNPAGLTRLPRLQLVAGGSLIGLSAKFEDGGSTASPLQPLGGVDGDPGDQAFVPNGYVSYEAIPGMIWTGIGVGVPFGLKTDWDPDWMGRFHAVKSEVKTININPTVAWKVAPWFSVGAGVNYQWVEATLTNSVNYSAIAAGAGVPPPTLFALTGCGTAAGGCEGIADVTADTWTWGWNIGAMFEAPTKTRIGLSYRSSMKHRAKGDVTFDNRPAPLAPFLPDGPVRATVELPDTASIAVVQQVVPRLELLADFTWTGWSSLEDLSIFRTDAAPPVREGLTSTPLEFDDSWRIGLGGNYQATDALKVRLGVAYDRSPVKDEFRTPRLPDDHRTWVGGGLQWAFLPQAALDVGFAYLFLSDFPSNLPSVDPDPPPGFTPALPRGGLVGEYVEPSVYVAAAQIKYSF